jgi:hypothetical protein
MGNGQPGLLHEARSIWSELRGIAHDQLQLAALETRLAGESVVRMIAAGVLIGVLLISAWLALLGAAVVVLIAAGLAPPLALLLAAAVNVAGAALLYLGVRRLARNLTFPATVRSVKPDPAPMQQQLR